MKLSLLIITVLLFTAAIAFGQSTTVRAKQKQFPQPVGYVNDFDDIFTDKEEKVLDSLIGNFEARTTIEIAVVTLHSAMTTKEEFDAYNLQLANAWGVGKREKDNGILIGISTSLRTIRISNGFGIEKVLTDAETKKIIDTLMKPEFIKGNYFEGTRKAILELIRKLE